MPTYVYKFVDTGETIEVQQSFTDDTLTEALHPSSGEMMPVKKVFQPVGVTFKGSGFFKTDNRGKKSATKAGSAGESGNGSSGSSDKTSKDTDRSKGDTSTTGDNSKKGTEGSSSSSSTESSSAAASSSTGSSG